MGPPSTLVTFPARPAFSELPLHIATGSCRSPCYNSHAFAVETFIDLCPVAGGIGPLEFRLQLPENGPRPGEKQVGLTVCDVVHLDLSKEGALKVYRMRPDSLKFWHGIC